MSRYSAVINNLTTKQTEQARPDQVKNNAGGYVFALDCWKRLDRFLVLGADSPTYYATERELVKDNAKVVEECIAKDGKRTVKRIVEISDAGRAPKNDAAIFALAMCAGAKDPETRKAALAALPKVCRIGTHLFSFAADVEGFRRWGRSLRTAVANWYTERGVDSLALQAAKYQQRNGWSHKDLLRLSHASSKDPKKDAVFRWITGGMEGVTKEAKRSKKVYTADDLPNLIQGFEAIHATKEMSPKSVAAMIRAFKLPHECVPNEHKNSAEVWDALSESMGITALIRNLGKMTNVGLLKPMSSVTRRVAAQLQDVELLKKGRVHPIALLTALKVYQSGHGMKGSLTWSPEREIVDALNEAFYLAFQAVVPNNKRNLLALDVSGSMGSGYVGGSPMTPREASAAMALVTARTEERWHIMGFSHELISLPISPKQRLDDVIRVISNLDFGSTDCALPMLYAAQKKMEVDAFTVLTDNETWYGAIHPWQALRKYREVTGIPAKLIVVGMTSSQFSIADPQDAGMLDCVGMDSATPAIMADFIRDQTGAG